MERPSTKVKNLRKILRWPSVIGAADEDGYVVVGTESCKSKLTKQRLILYHSPTEELDTIMPHEVNWSESHRNIAILSDALRELVNMKSDEPFDRGGVAVRLVDNRVYLMECGYRDTLRPRYWWTLPSSMNHVEALAWLIQEESLNPDTLIAVVDPRESVELVEHLLEQ